MASTDTLTYIRLREIPMGRVESFEVEAGASFRNVLWSCDFVEDPEIYEVLFRDQHGNVTYVSLDEQVNAHVHEHDQEFLVSLIDGCGTVIISHS